MQNKTRGMLFNVKFLVTKMKKMFFSFNFCFSLTTYDKFYGSLQDC